MNKYVTVEHYDGTIAAYTVDEDYNPAIQHGDTACWVWHYAANKADAIANHYVKMDEWEADVAAGRTEKEAY